MRLSFKRWAGFSLIELMIGLAILAILLLLAAPSYSVWIADSQIQNAAESIASGLRYAQSQAILLNEPVRFVIDPTTKTGGWVVQLDTAGTQVQAGPFVEGAARAQFVPNPAGATTITYSGLGRIVVNTDASPTLDKVAITMPTTANSRELDVVFGIGGFTGIKICDPLWPATDPKGCPT